MTHFNYENAARESITCNLCGRDCFVVMALRAASGLRVQTVLCKYCGFIYINPRITKEEYDRYYHSFYRSHRAEVKQGGDAGGNLEKNFVSSRRLGVALGKRLQPYMDGSGIALDVGSSTGGVLVGLREVFPKLSVKGIEPSSEESQYAKAHGIPTHTGLFENFIVGEGNNFPPAALILCVRSLNHLLDPRGFVRWCFEHLEENGHLLLEVKNFRHQCRRAGSFEAGVQIDHPFMFTPETLVDLVAANGFRVLYLDNDEFKTHAALIRQREEGLSLHHIRLIAEKTTLKSLVHLSKGTSRRLRSWKLRIQFARPFIRLYCFLFYAPRLSFVRNIFLRS